MQEIRKRSGSFNTSCSSKIVMQKAYQFDKQVGLLCYLEKHITKPEKVNFVKNLIKLENCKRF